MLTFFFERSSKFIGVSKHDTKKPWYAKLCTRDKQQYLGFFKTEIDGAKSVNAACKKYNKPIKNTELSDEDEEKFSWPKKFNKPLENITWANFLTTPKQN